MNWSAYEVVILAEVETALPRGMQQRAVGHQEDPSCQRVCLAQYVIQRAQSVLNYCVSVPVLMEEDAAVLLPDADAVPLPAVQELPTAVSGVWALVLQEKTVKLVTLWPMATHLLRPSCPPPCCLMWLKS